MLRGPIIFLLLLALITLGCWSEQKNDYDFILRSGTVYDGSGNNPYVADVGLTGDTIAFIGNLSGKKAKTEIDVKDLAVAPGFINMLSWADGNLVKDGRSMSDLKQGVTLEIFGEGWSPGPKLDSTKLAPWKSLGQYFDFLEKKGVTPNFASFVGATTIRSYVLDQENRKPTAAELTKMRLLTHQAMRDGAMGLGSSLIYAPADYASTEELIELSKVASAYGGMYISHIRNESDRIFPALDELFRIAREANIRAEIYHLKINQKWNWDKVDAVLAKIDSAQKAGLKITADMYTYNASGTGLIARLPTWLQEGGAREMRKRLKNPVIRKRVLKDLALGIPNRNSDPRDVMVMGFRTDSLNALYKGKRLDEIARLHGKNADETLLDLIVLDKSSVPSIFFLISEENVKRMLQLPYVSICSDAGSIPAEEPYVLEGTHPRTYGSFARLLGKYVREEKLMTLQEAVRRLTSLPAKNLNIKKRGILKAGYFADLAIFDPDKVQDHATFEKPHQYSSGMVHVFVNGTQVLSRGEHTGAMPGKCIRGNGWTLDLRP
jgi:N-acyl-D-amino-acid deacylase